MTWIDVNTTKPPANEHVLFRTTAGNYRVGFYSPNIYSGGEWIELSTGPMLHRFTSSEIERWVRIETQTKDLQP